MTFCVDIVINAPAYDYWFKPVTVHVAEHRAKYPSIDFHMI